MNIPDRRPVIGIFYDEKLENSGVPVEEVVYGIEEEGLLSQLVAYKGSFPDEQSFLAYTYLQCQSSILGVSVGISEKFIVLHDKKMKPEYPVLIYKNDLHPALFRTFGQNAARLVKCKPLIITNVSSN